MSLRATDFADPLTGHGFRGFPLFKPRISRISSFFKPRISRISSRQATDFTEFIFSSHGLLGFHRSDRGRSAGFTSTRWVAVLAELVSSVNLGLRVHVVRGVRHRIRLGLLTAAALAILIWAVGTREEWGPELATDPAYRSGRVSVCKAPAPGGEIWPSHVQDRGPRPLERGSEHATVHTFDTAEFTGGAIDMCSEYGFVKLAGVGGRQGRVEINVDCDRSTGPRIPAPGRRHCNRRITGWDRRV
jgi:hypothetical protein